MPTAPSDDQIAALRRFTRFYTRCIGVLQEGLLGSGFSMTEARILYELANRERPTATEIGRDLALDGGYLSRILKRFEDQGLMVRTRAGSDARRSHLDLTSAGRESFAPLDRSSSRQANDLLSRLQDTDRSRLVKAMKTIEELLQTGESQAEPCLLRSHRPGDLGWIVHRHGALYAREFGWDLSFEALVAEIVAKFVRDFDPQRERCWIAERDGEIVGSVLLVAETEEVAKLRLLYVEPKARGFGLGTRLVEECVGFAREAGYRRVSLWTNDVLKAARAIYAATGFKLVRSEPHHSFGHDLVGEVWEMALS
jgi:DNA-binding MarR family transcriptional regulator/N-acetylglutamate synthase-like GNAT family acetyltransferase